MHIFVSVLPIEDTGEIATLDLTFSSNNGERSKIQLEKEEVLKK